MKAAWMVFLTTWAYCTFAGDLSLQGGSEMSNALVRSLQSSVQAEVITAQRLLAEALYTQTASESFVRAVTQVSKGKEVVRWIEALRSNDPDEARKALVCVADIGAFGVLIGEIRDPNLSLATSAVVLARQRRIKQALPTVKELLVDNIGVIGGGGAELQVLRDTYLLELWRTFLSLTDSLNQDWNDVPTRDVLARIKAIERDENAP